MSTSQSSPDVRPARAVERLPATVPLAAGLLVVEAIVVFEHARRLFSGITLAEETLGLTAIRQLNREVPVALIEVFAAISLLIAAYAIVRRSRFALVVAVVFQAVIALDAVLQLVRGLAALPAVGLLVLAVLAGATLLGPKTRAWCDEPQPQLSQG